jgi:hypothetical protein
MTKAKRLKLPHHFWTLCLDVLEDFGFSLNDRTYKVALLRLTGSSFSEIAFKEMPEIGCTTKARKYWLTAIEVFKESGHEELQEFFYQNTQEKMVGEYTKAKERGTNVRKI